MVEEKIGTLIEPLLQSLGLELWACRVHQSGQRSILRILIDRKDGAVSLDDCTAVSREVGALLDVEDLIKTRYQLEVSSPGVNRELSTLPHFMRYRGATVMVKLRAPHKSQGIAKIEKIENDTIFLTMQDVTIPVTLGDIKKCELSQSQK